MFDILIFVLVKFFDFVMVENVLKVCSIDFVSNDNENIILFVFELM